MGQEASRIRTDENVVRTKRRKTKEHIRNE